MIEEEICKLRDELNKSIVTGQDYQITYKISVELDELIAKYYNQSIKKQKKNNKKYNLLSFV